MPRERYKPEEIVAKLRQEVFVPAFAGVAGFATWSGSAGHASPTDSIKLTFYLDHSIWAAQDDPPRTHDVAQPQCRPLSGSII